MHARILADHLARRAVGGRRDERAVSALRAQSQADASALTGTVSSAEEARWKACSCRSKRAGSTQTTTVVTDKEGRYRFPRTRLDDAGSYAVSIRAIGYDLASEPSVSVPATECDDRGSEAEKDDSDPGRAADER